MPIVISTGGQTRARNSYQSSAQCRLTLRVNGEDSAVVITDSGQVVPAGFAAPTTTPVATLGAGGNVAIGYYVWRYVYASSRYPFVENAVTGGNGQLWPRSSPSPASNTLHVTPASIVSVTGAYTTRSDVDFIWMYRTSVQATQALAEAQANAGRFFYVGQIANLTAGGTFTYTDNSATDTGEALELDNYECPLFRQTVFDGFQWWGWGNRTLTVVVQLDDTATITTGIAPYGGSWGDGRNEPPATISFLGITTGGFDGRGTFYFRALTSTTANIFNSSAMVSPVTISATGLTTAYLTAPSTTLYKSKPLNPFSWGKTEQVFIPNTSPQQTRNVPSLFAEQIGGGVGTAISLIPNERILKLDTEGPERSYALDLNAANSSDFIGTLRTLDDANSVGSQFSQFPMRNEQGQSYGTGINAKSLQIVMGDSQSQIPIGGPVITTLRSLVRTDEIPTFFHGVYDRNTELNCWWVKTDADEDNTIDTLIYQHAPTGTWGLKHDPGVTASWTVFDATTEEYYSFIGTDQGWVGAAFSADVFQDYTAECNPASLFLAEGGENALTIPIYAEVSSLTYDSTGYALTVTTTTPHGLSTGALVEFALSSIGNLTDTAYAIHTVTATTFKVDVTTPGSGTISTANAVMPPVFFVNSVLSVAGLGMFYISFPGNNLTGGSFNTGDLSVVFSNVAYALTSIYDYSPAGTLPEAAAYDIYIGGIPCFLRRYFNASTPEAQKATGEIYITALDSAVTAGPSNTLLAKFYANYNDTADATRVIGLQPNYNQDATTGPMFFTKNPPSDLTPTIGIEVLQISTTAFQLLDFTTKEKPA